MAPSRWFRAIEPARVQAMHDSQYPRDAIGHRLHVVFGICWCVLVCAPTSVVEWAALPIVFYGLMRSYHAWRIWPSALLQPLTLAVLAWSAWQTASLLWSANPEEGRDEVGVIRFIGPMLTLWPVMDRRAWFIAALGIGFAIAQLSQVGHAIGLATGMEWLVFPRFEGRNSGWWDPVVGGSLLVAGLGLHLPAALMGRGRTRALGLAGATATGLGILATGTRGAWFAGAALVAVGVGVAVARAAVRGSRSSRDVWRAAAIGAGILVVAAGAGWLLAGDALTARFEAGRQEVSRAIREQDYDSDTGARILMWRWAALAYAENPVAGVGAGGYRPWVLRRLRKQENPPPARRIHAHAHSAPLHAAATLGTIGLVLGGAVVLLALRGGFTELGAGGLGSYAAGPAFAVAGLVLAGLFDTIQVNAQTVALLATLFSLCFVSRPRHPGQKEAAA